MASTEIRDIEPDNVDQQSGPQLLIQEIAEVSHTLPNVAEDVKLELQSPVGQKPATVSEESTAAPMEQDPQPDVESQPGGEEPAPVSEEPVPQSEGREEAAEAAADAPPTPAKHTAPLVESDGPAPLVESDCQAPADEPAAAAAPAQLVLRLPAGEAAEKPAAPLPPPPGLVPVPLMPLDRAEVVNSVLAGRRSAAAIFRPPTKLQLPLPREGFMCDQCSERFVLPSSLALHQNRRTMEIAFKCKHCDKTCLFDNKCRFLEHLDQHGVDVQSLDPESVDVSALSASDLSSPTRMLPTLGSRLLTGPPRMVRMVTSEPVHRPVEISCPMCNTLCTTDTLRAHMCPPSSDALEAVPPRCPECAQPCPSECALLAHHGLHKPNLFPYPYVCPECSVKVLGSHEEYRRHVVAGCLHLTRDLKICCAVCLIEVGDVKSHMLQTHVQKLYKCRKCPLAFESINGFNSHIQGKHGGEPMLGETPYMPILKCPFCAATFNHPKTLREHLGSKKHGDRALEQIRFVFRCPECGVDYGRKELLSDHLAQKHPDFQIVVMDMQGEPVAAAAAPVPPPVAPTPPPPAPAPLVAAAAAATGRLTKQALPLAGGGAPMPMPKIKLEPGRKPVVLHRCIVCQSEFRRKSAYTEHMRTHIEDGVPLCLLCNCAFDSPELLKNHIAEHAAEIGSDRCGLCYAKLGSRDALQLHLETEHDLRDFSCPYCQLQFSALSDLLRHNFAKHRGAAQGRPARPKAAPQPAPGALAADDEDDDDLPLSRMAGKKAAVLRAVGTLPAVTSLYELDSESSSVVSDEAGDGRRRRGGGGRAGRGGVKRPRPAGDDGPPRLSRVVKRSRSPDEAPPPEEAVAAPTPPRSNYRCVCCGLQTDVRADFVAHVALHRQGSQHQCPECGQCYSTKPSLLKHLLLVHRLREPPPEVAASEQQRELQQWEQLTRDLEPGQCHVCRAQCGDEERLQRHLRMHGRAALRAHQRDQARRQRRSQPATDDGRAETLEAIASFVAGSGTLPADDEDGEEVIELEMKDGQVTQKQFRKGVPIVHDESSDDEVPMEDLETPPAARGNGETPAAPGKVKTAPAAVTVADPISANGHPEEAVAVEQADPVPA